MVRVFFVGLDLGQAQDYTAMAVAEKTQQPGEMGTYAIRDLLRFELGTKYTAIVEAVGQLMLRDPLAGIAALVVDETGCGKAVIDMLNRERADRWPLYPVTITGGNKAAFDPPSYHVPKRDLVSIMKVLQQSRRVKVAPTLPLAETLVRELLNFQVKITDNGRDTYGAWREGSHDDLLLAVALACWAGERHQIRRPAPQQSYRLVATAPETSGDGWDPFARYRRPG